LQRAGGSRSHDIGKPKSKCPLSVRPLVLGTWRWIVLLGLQVDGLVVADGSLIRHRVARRLRLDRRLGWRAFFG
jgi:hypothetical protein